MAAAKGALTWRVEILRALDTLEMIRACVAPSPRRDAWVARTEAGIAAMVVYYMQTYPHDKWLLAVKEDSVLLTL